MVTGTFFGRFQLYGNTFVRGKVLHTRLSPQDLEFQNDVEEFLDSQFTPSLAAKIADRETYKEGMIEWQRVLHEKGWIAPGWPKEFGGTGWTETQRFVFNNERSKRGVPEANLFGLKMVAPVIYTFGNKEQQAHFLPRILDSTDWWCQGYSEPGSGSDLASLQTRAVRDGDEYVVNGAKIWTTNAQYADWIFCLVRTDPVARRPQEGITFLLIDMKSPGISISPIITIDGRHSLNQVTFDDVRVPLGNCIGEENKGWTYAKALLTHERAATAGVAECKRLLSHVKRYAGSEMFNGRTMMHDPAFRRRLATVETELLALEFTEFRVLSQVAAGGAPGAESSFLKIKGTEMQQAVQRLMMELAGPFGGVVGSDEDIGHEFGDDARINYMYGRASTIYSGSNEVQRNIIAKAILGL